MNILIATEAFYPDDVGGAHIYVKHYADGLVKKGHKVWVITIRLNENLPDSQIIDGINVCRYDSAPDGKLVFIRRPVLSILNSLKLFKKISGIVKFDIISCHSILPAAGILDYAKRKHIPVVYTFHSSLFEDVKVQARKKTYALKIIKPLMLHIIKLIEGKCYGGASKIVVLSDFSRRYLSEEFKVPHEKIANIPGGVDLTVFSPRSDKLAAREQMGLPKDRIIFLTVRRLVARMGLENLVLAMPAAVKLHKDVLLLIIGEGFLETKLREIIKKNLLAENVRLLGRKDINEVAKFMQASDVFILPSEESEWFGLVTLEAMACGLPILATPIGGTIEILKGLNSGSLLDGTSSRDISSGMLRLIDLKYKWGEIGKRCRDYVVGNYSWEKVVTQNETLLLGENANEQGR